MCNKMHRKKSKKVKRKKKTCLAQMFIFIEQICLLEKHHGLFCCFFSRSKSHLPRIPPETKLSARTRVSTSNSSFNFSEVLVSQVVLLERVCLGCGEMLESCQASHW